MAICPKIKVLIIDDEQAILSILSRWLDKVGYIVDVANTAEKGIDNINSIPYDLIITDIKMPGMSGHDVLRYLRTNIKKQIPIIATSGTPWLLENSNFNAVIAKPFGKEDLLGVVNQFF